MDYLQLPENPMESSPLIIGITALLIVLAALSFVGAVVNSPKFKRSVLIAVFVASVVYIFSIVVVSTTTFVQERQEVMSSWLDSNYDVTLSSSAIKSFIHNEGGVIDYDGKPTEVKLVSILDKGYILTYGGKIDVVPQKD